MGETKFRSGERLSIIDGPLRGQEATFRWSTATGARVRLEANGSDVTLPWEAVQRWTADRAPTALQVEAAQHAEREAFDAALAARRGEELHENYCAGCEVLFEGASDFGPRWACADCEAIGGRDGYGSEWLRWRKRAAELGFAAERLELAGEDADGLRAAQAKALEHAERIERKINGQPEEKPKSKRKAKAEPVAEAAEEPAAQASAVAVVPPPLERIEPEPSERRPRGRYHRRDMAPRYVMSKDETRAHINALSLEADGSVVGTDGHALIQVVPAHLDERAPERVPALLRPDALHVELAKLQVAQKEPIPFLAIEGDSSPETAFPDWRRVRDSSLGEEAKATVQLDPELLGRVLKAAIEFLGKGGEGLTLEVRGAGDPVVLRGRHDEAGEFFSLVMPISA